MKLLRQMPVLIISLILFYIVPAALWLAAEEFIGPVPWLLTLAEFFFKSGAWLVIAFFVWMFWQAQQEF